jgi:hypothetical protein
LTPAEIERTRARMAAAGIDVSALSVEDLQRKWAERARRFEEDAPTSAAEAARIILDGVKAERWRILVGEDAHRLDERVRADPEHAYDAAFFESFVRESGWRVG